MKKRLLSFAGCFLVLVGTYWAYALLAVPLIEPSTTWRDNSTDDAPIDRGSRLTSEYAAEFARLFAPGSWELDNQITKILETDNGKLLFQDYKPQPDGQMEVTPLTVIVYTSGRTRDGAKSPASKRPIVIRAPDGAILRFDRPLDLARGEVGRLIGGRLRGQIDIYGPESSLGAGDDLAMVTRNIHLDERRIETVHDVQFRFGQHYGSGRHLVIDLAPRSQKAKGLEKNFAAGGVDSLKLVHVDEVQLQVAKSKWMSEQDAGQERAESPSYEVAVNSPAITPIQVTCRGPFHFDFQQNVASFEQDVSVVNTDPAGPGDRLDCERLAIHFTRRRNETTNDSATEDPNQNARSSGLEVEMLVATGMPATLDARSQFAFAKGEHLEYDLQRRRVYLRGADKAYFRHRDQEIEAPEVEYLMGPPGRLGQLVARGPGAIRGRVGKEADQFVAQWIGGLDMQRQEDLHVVSLSGEAGIELVDTGGFTGDEIHLWLREVPRDRDSATNLPQPKEHYKVQPEKLTVVGNVRINSPQLTGVTKRMDVFFENVASTDSDEANLHNEDGSLLAADSMRANDDSGSFNVFDPYAAVTTSDANDEPLAQSPPRNVFHITGDAVKINVRRQGKQTSAEEVTVTGKVRLIETQTARPDELPLDLNGETLKLFPGQHDQANAVAHVFGEPAQVSARGLTLISANIHFDQGNNRLWIDGSGQMLLEGQPRGLRDSSAGVQNVIVDWKRRMDFDGLTATFLDDVEVTGRQTLDDGSVRHIKVSGIPVPSAQATDFTAAHEPRQAKTTMKITLTKRVDFQRTRRGDDKPDLARLVYDGGVYMQNRTIGAQGAQLSYEQLQAHNLLMDQISGALRADGPGWANSVRVGGSTLTATPSSVTAYRPDGSPTPKPLTYVHVDFQRGIEGDNFRREVSFVEQVSAVYGPVSQWDQKLDPIQQGGLGDDGILLNCDRLTVTEMPPAPDGGRPVELQAIGNTHVEGRQFEADAQRISYAEASDLLVLQGNDRTPAELRHQQRIGGRRDRAVAHKIWYWRQQGRVQVDNAQVLDLTNFGAFQPSPPADPR